ncbi:hypothetical protein ANO11243_027120 [Dothideomycetidae sp. 11243]|nr:hypothetical protein ANO11243_027120 [fungal sp. No.11243]
MQACRCLDQSSSTNPKSSTARTSNHVAGTSAARTSSATRHTTSSPARSSTHVSSSTQKATSRIASTTRITTTSAVPPTDTLGPFAIRIFAPNGSSLNNNLLQISENGTPGTSEVADVTNNFLYASLFTLDPSTKRLTTFKVDPGRVAGTSSSSGYQPYWVNGSTYTTPDTFVECSVSSPDNLLSCFDQNGTACGAWIDPNTGTFYLAPPSKMHQPGFVNFTLYAELRSVVCPEPMNWTTVTNSVQHWCESDQVETVPFAIQLRTDDPCFDGQFITLTSVNNGPSEQVWNLQTGIAGSPALNLNCSSGLLTIASGDGAGFVLTAGALPLAGWVDPTAGYNAYYMNCSISTESLISCTVPGTTGYDLWSQMGLLHWYPTGADYQVYDKMTMYARKITS